MTSWKKRCVILFGVPVISRHTWCTGGELLNWYHVLLLQFQSLPGWWIWLLKQMSIKHLVVDDPAAPRFPLLQALYFCVASGVAILFQVFKSTRCWFPFHHRFPPAVCIAGLWAHGRAEKRPQRARRSSVWAACNLKDVDLAMKCYDYGC